MNISGSQIFQNLRYSDKLCFINRPIPAGASVKSLSQEVFDEFVREECDNDETKLIYSLDCMKSSTFAVACQALGKIDLDDWYLIDYVNHRSGSWSDVSYKTAINYFNLNPNIIFKERFCSIISFRTVLEIVEEVRTNASLIIQNAWKDARVNPNCQIGYNKIQRDMDFAGLN